MRVISSSNSFSQGILISSLNINVTLFLTRGQVLSSVNKSFYTRFILNSIVFFFLDFFEKEGVKLLGVLLNEAVDSMVFSGKGGIYWCDVVCN